MTRTAARSIVVPRPDLCLDFANTLYYRGSPTKTETLHQFSDLLEWCRTSGALPPDALDKLAMWAAKNPDASAELFRDAIQLRETIYRVFLSRGSGSHPAPADLKSLNDALAAAPARTTVASSADSFGWRLEIESPSADSILAAVLWSAGDLLVGANRARIRHCANDRCLWLFIDDSKNQSRRWCSMSACGNRAKAHRHYLRQKGL
ncbi:MAG TPA: ABATE domain-containing protein [Candidatus Binataceae bacterium]|nr:ABATE domain-containing protein [Candidatus Binataceae bacterium]